jgi:dipeptidyl-peptidase-4
MRPTRTLLLVLLLCSSASVAAQQQLTLRDAILKAGTELAPERLSGLQWIGGTPAYSHVRNGQLLRGTLGKSMDEVVIDLEGLNAALKDTTKLAAMPAVKWQSPTAFRFLHKGQVYTFDTRTGALATGARVAEGGSHTDLHEGSGRVAYTLGNDLHIATPGSAPVRITSDGTDGILNGHAVHREEYGISKGTFWSPQGNMLAFYRMDETMVSTYSLEDINARPSTFKTVRYPMAGQASHHVTMGVYNVTTGRTTWLATGGPADHYLTNISWSNDERFVHVVHLDRATRHLRLVRYNASTGEEVATLLEEHDEKYLEPQHPAHFLEGRGGSYIWWSQRDGWWHLYLYDATRGLARQLTRGNWVVKRLVGVDPKGGFAIVEGTDQIEIGRPTGALDTHLYRVELSTGKTARLTREPGTHRGQLSSDGRYLIDTWSSMSVPARTEIIDARTGQVVKTLLAATDPLEKYAVGNIELLHIRGEEGNFLNARLIKPSHFDAERKYPVLIYVYNGPHVQLVSNSRLAGSPLWMIEAAERGYLVWTVDGHGSAHRGRDFEQVIHRRLGIVEVKDQMRGVDYLKGLPYVDGERLAVHGWSYGGHMTTAMLLRHPGTFKVGVAGGPVMDWGLYEVMYTERYMDTPAENPEGYAATALPPLARDLQDDLLLITGVQDDVVLPQHGLSFIAACVEQGVQLDYFAYPGHGHNVRGRDRLHLMEKVLRHIDQKVLFMR